MLAGPRNDYLPPNIQQMCMHPTPCQSLIFPPLIPLLQLEPPEHPLAAFPLPVRAFPLPVRLLLPVALPFSSTTFCRGERMDAWIQFDPRRSIPGPREPTPGVNMPSFCSVFDPFSHHLTAVFCLSEAKEVCFHPKYIYIYIISLASNVEV